MGFPIFDDPTDANTIPDDQLTDLCDDTMLLAVKLVDADHDATADLKIFPMPTALNEELDTHDAIDFIFAAIIGENEDDGENVAKE